MKKEEGKEILLELGFSNTRSEDLGPELYSILKKRDLLKKTTKKTVIKKTAVVEEKDVIEIDNTYLKEDEEEK